MASQTVCLCSKLQPAGAYRMHSSFSCLFWLHKSRKGKETGALLCSLSPACLWTLLIRNHPLSLRPWGGECCNPLGGNHAQQRYKCWGVSGSFSMGPILSDAYFNTELQLRSSWGCCSLGSTVFCVLVGNRCVWAGMNNLVSYHASAFEEPLADSKSIVV